jgi:hypothetical protein
MWFHNMGNEDASGFGLLRIILEVNMKLFGKIPKKKILIVVRDFDEQGNNLKNNTDKLTDDFKKLWINIENKPEKF